MKKFLLQVVLVVVFVLVAKAWVGYVTGDPQVEKFVVHTIQKGETAQEIIDSYNGGGVDAEYSEQLMLLNPSVEFKAGNKIQVPVFAH